MSKKSPVIDKENLPTLVDKEILCPEDGWHVKIFELNEDNIWTDRGTGRASIVQQVSFRISLEWCLQHLRSFREW